MCNNIIICIEVWWHQHGTLFNSVKLYNSTNYIWKRIDITNDKKKIKQKQPFVPSVLQYVEKRKNIYKIKQRKNNIRETLIQLLRKKRHDRKADMQKTFGVQMNVVVWEGNFSFEPEIMYLRKVEEFDIAFLLFSAFRRKSSFIVRFLVWLRNI